MYFISLTEDSYILNKMNTVSKDNEEIFVIDLSQAQGKRKRIQTFSELMISIFIFLNVLIFPLSKIEKIKN